MSVEKGLLGKITFARFLERPLRSYQRLIEEQESSPEFPALGDIVEITSLPGARVGGFESHEKSPVLGKIETQPGGVHFLYASEYFAREYRFQESTLEERLKAAAPSLRSLVRRLKLINSRNRLTHAVVNQLVTAQQEFLSTNNFVYLKELPQTELAKALRSSIMWTTLDDGRVSRLLHGLSIIFPDGRVRPLRLLCPSSRQVHRHLIEHIIREEANSLARGTIREPLTDEKIAAETNRRFGTSLSRRTVAHTRKDLGIGGYRTRSASHDFTPTNSTHFEGSPRRNKPPK